MFGLALETGAMTSQTHGLNNSCPKIYKPAAGG
jgi:hypothetical protein